MAIAGLQDIADQFDHVLLDQWGALHKGDAVYPEARACVRALRSAGKGVLILSNSGRRSKDNVERLASLGLPAKEHDGVLTSGEVVWRGLRDRSSPPYNTFGRHALLVGRGNVLSLLEDLEFVAVINPGRADFIWLAGLDEDSADLEVWRQDLGSFAERDVPMLCANPDLTMFTSRGLTPAPGAVAQIYAGLGGTVHYIGKPHPAIFAAALQRLGNPKSERVLVIGDSLDHDVAGGQRAGMLTALITSGIHAEALTDRADLDVAIRDLASDPIRMPHWAIPRLVW